jgi:hypothetical protein
MVSAFSLLVLVVFLFDQFNFLMHDGGNATG